MLRYDNSDFYLDMNYALMGIDSLLDNLNNIPENRKSKISGDIENLESLQQKLAKIVDDEKQQKKLNHQLEEWSRDDLICYGEAA